MSALVSKIFPISDADIKKVRSNYGKTEDDIQMDLDIIIAWLEQEVHLPKEHDRKRLERFLLRNKFRLERTKQKLDAYYCSRNWYGEFFVDLDPRSSRMKRIKNITYHVPLPKLTPAMERVVIMKVGKNIKDYHNLDVMSLLMLMVDIQLSYDYADSDRIVIDLEGYTMQHFKTSNVSHVSKTAALYLNCFSGRLGGVDIINPIPFLPMFMSLLKMCLPAKLMERVRAHKNLDSFFEFVPKEILPADYGGNEKSLHELHEDTWNMIHEQRDFILKQASMVSNEELRINGDFSNDFFGTDGSFKKINLD